MKTKFSDEWAEKGFEKRSVDMMVRRNRQWTQVVLIGKDGKEKLFLMQEVQELFDLKKKESAW
jgi:hypothetical protein